MTGTQPRLDAYATAAQGVPLEDLARIPANQPFRSEGPLVPYRALNLLAQAGQSVPHEDSAARDALAEADLVTADGEPTEAGRAIAETWRSSTVQLAVNAFGLGERTAFVARIGGGRAVVAAGPSAAELLAGQVHDPEPVRVQLASLAALPLLVASWVGLAPAWQFVVRPDRLPAALVEARVADPTVACPDEADENLRQMWAQPWVDWRVQTTPNGNTVGYLSAGERGQFVSWIEGDKRVLDARPPMHVWRDLIRLVDAAVAAPA
ncbi:MAG TPA: hypothetical protein VH395_14725 [Jatrophihabitantaceae bacterium]